ncbi:MAG: aldehyde ferredoxin oxidoreductase, partial [Deltaproteobacteria bacterium]
NEFYQQLGQGTLAAARRYGGEDFACVLGQEMAGYATGEVFFAAQSLGFRHSHLDSGGYSYDQKHAEKDVEKAVNFLMDDEPGRCLLSSMVSCLFARGVYNEDLLAECMRVSGFSESSGNLSGVAEHIRTHRWKLRFATGFKPEEITLPKRFYKITTWKGKVDASYLDNLKAEYARRIEALVQA